MGKKLGKGGGGGKGEGGARGGELWAANWSAQLYSQTPRDLPIIAQITGKSIMCQMKTSVSKSVKFLKDWDKISYHTYREYSLYIPVRLPCQVFWICLLT